MKNTDNRESIALKCKRGAESALEMIGQGKSSGQANEEFERHAGTKLRYRNRADFVRLLKFYASYWVNSIPARRV